MNFARILYILPTLWFPQVYCVRTGMWQEIQALSHPEDNWGPAEESNRSGRYICHDDDVEDNAEKEGETLVALLLRQF